MSVSTYKFSLIIAFYHDDKYDYAERFMKLYTDLDNLFEGPLLDLEKKLKKCLSKKICKSSSVDALSYTRDRILRINISCNTKNFNDSFKTLYRMNPETIVDYIQEEVKKVVF